MKTEPVMALAVVVAAALGIFGKVADVDAIYNVAVVLVPLIGGLLARAHVIPTGKVPPATTTQLD